MANKSTPKPLSAAQKYAKMIVDGIKAKTIVMGKAQKVTGKDKDGNALSGLRFVSQKTKTGAVIEVRQEESKALKHPRYTISLTANGVTQKFSGAQARRAYKVLTHVPKVRASSLSGENIRFCEEHLNYLGTADLK